MSCKRLPYKGFRRAKIARRANACPIRVSAHSRFSFRSCRGNARPIRVSDALVFPHASMRRLSRRAAFCKPRLQKAACCANARPIRVSAASPYASCIGMHPAPSARQGGVSRARAHSRGWLASGPAGGRRRRSASGRAGASLRGSLGGATGAAGAQAWAGGRSAPTPSSTPCATTIRATPIRGAHARVAHTRDAHARVAHMRSAYTRGDHTRDAHACMIVRATGSRSATSAVVIPALLRRARRRPANRAGAARGSRPESASRPPAIGP